MKIAFFEIGEWEKNFLEKALPNQDLYFFDTKLSEANFPTQTDFEVISVFTDSQITRELLTKFPNLKLVATRTTGIDHIDSQEAEKNGVKILNVPNYGEHTVAEFTFALLLTLSRKIHLSIDKVKERGDFGQEGLTGFDLFGKTLGVIGTGNIGQRVITIGKGFGMRVIAFDVRKNQEIETQLGFTYTGFDQLLEQSDVLTLHVPYLPTTHHLINQENFTRIKRGAVLINTARGAIIETQALIKALQQGILSAAGLDVLEEEAMMKNANALVTEGKLSDEDLRTLWQNNVLMNYDNVVMTPHNAYNTREALMKILEQTVLNIKSLSTDDQS